MKIKRLLACLLIFVTCFTWISCGKDTSVPKTTQTPEISFQITPTPDVLKDDKTPENSPQATPTPEVSQKSIITPLLYRVTDESGNIIWLFGSIHVGREAYYPLPDYVQNAFESSDSLAVELDVVAFEKDLNLQVNALSQVVYRDGSTIKDYISQELYEKAVAIFKEYNSYVSLLDMYSPAFWGSMIESLMMTELGGDPNLGIDRHMIDNAYKAEKEIIEIESAEFQYKMLADFDDNIQRMILESAIDMYENKEKASDDFESLMDLWASGDERAFCDYLNASDDTLTDTEKEASEKYDKIIVKDRNLTMANFAEDALLDGKEIFICVGAAHIVGDGAVADLLADRGYNVECITK